MSKQLETYYYCETWLSPPNASWSRAVLYFIKNRVNSLIVNTPYYFVGYLLTYKFNSFGLMLKASIICGLEMRYLITYTLSINSTEFVSIYLKIYSHNYSSDIAGSVFFFLLLLRGDLLWLSPTLRSLNTALLWCLACFRAGLGLVLWYSYTTLPCRGRIPTIPNCPCSYWVCCANNSWTSFGNHHSKSLSIQIWIVATFAKALCS